MSKRIRAAESEIQDLRAERLRVVGGELGRPVAKAVVGGWASAIWKRKKQET